MGKLADSAFPGIVDVVEQEEERFLIMEWIEGETLAAQMERDGAFAEETVIEIGICLAKAIQKLHQMQPPLLYLDCKPSNVMKDSDGKIRLIDFGSALEAHTPVTKGISASPGYAAPEQLSREIEKRCVDVRTAVSYTHLDVYKRQLKARHDDAQGDRHHSVQAGGTADPGTSGISHG